MAMTWQESVWRQFGAAIDMLENALSACPEDLWEQPLFQDPAAPSAFAEFWYIAFHTLFWLDFYLSDSAEGFTPPAPYTLSELESGGLPDRVYTKAELRNYLEHGRTQCRNKLASLESALVPQRVRSDWPDMSVAELLIYNLRHVQEHAAQLSLFLGQRVGSAPGWVAKAGGKGKGA